MIHGLPAIHIVFHNVNHTYLHLVSQLHKVRGIVMYNNYQLKSFSPDAKVGAVSRVDP